MLLVVSSVFVNPSIFYQLLNSNNKSLPPHKRQHRHSLHVDHDYRSRKINYFDRDVLFVFDHILFSHLKNHQIIRFPFSNHCFHFLVFIDFARSLHSFLSNKRKLFILIEKTTDHGNVYGSTCRNLVFTFKTSEWFYLQGISELELNIKDLPEVPSRPVSIG